MFSKFSLTQEKDNEENIIVEEDKLDEDFFDDEEWDDDFDGDDDFDDEELEEEFNRILH